MDTYMLLIRGMEFPTKSDEEYAARMQQYGPWKERLSEAGKYVSGAPLESTVGWQLKMSGEVSTDGPYMEAKEIIGGYIMVKAESIEAAMEIAKECPLRQWHTIEVRKVGAAPQ